MRLSIILPETLLTLSREQSPLLFRDLSDQFTIKLQKLLFTYQQSFLQTFVYLRHTIQVDNRSKRFNIPETFASQKYHLFVIISDYTSIFLSLLTIKSIYKNRAVLKIDIFHVH